MAENSGFQIRQTPEEWSEWVEVLTAVLHSRTRWRFPIVLLGVLFARGRRTVTTWLRAQGISTDYEDYYYFLASLGHKIEPVATELFRLLLAKLVVGNRITLAIDDTPTKRYGPHVEGCGVHRNPTTSASDSDYFYGHIWVTMAVVLRHPLWHMIGLPVRALMYVKQKDMPKIAGRCDWEFRTKLQLAVELVKWAVKLLEPSGKSIWLVVDGAYANRPIFREVLPLGVTVVSRLRKDSALCTVPPPRPPGYHGGTRRYGKERISLLKRGAHPKGWQTLDVVLYGGQKTTKTYKTFLATWRPVGGIIRVVIVREVDNCEFFFCTDPNAGVAEILECFASRTAIEQVFHDIKEVWGAAQQQVRNLFTNVACFHLNLWMHTLVEIWAWNKPANQIRNRNASPWDTTDRRPSHADRRKALCRKCLQLELLNAQVKHQISRPIKKLIQTLTSLAT